MTLLAIAVLGRIPPRRLLLILAPMAALLAGLMVLYPVAAARDVVADTPVLVTLGPVEVNQGGVLLGLSTGLRIIAIISLTLLFALTTDVMDFIRALVQRWRVPYRIGYTAMAGLRFLPRFTQELQVIAAAHRVRGLSDRGGLRARAERASRYVVPLLSSGIRHAERVALAMDARGFGAYPPRTYRREITFHHRDLTFVAVGWTTSVAVPVAVSRAGLLAPLFLLGRGCCPVPHERTRAGQGHRADRTTLAGAPTPGSRAGAPATGSQLVAACWRDLWLSVELAAQVTERRTGRFPLRHADEAPEQGPEQGPLVGTPSTHLREPPDQRCLDVAANEVLCRRLAHARGPHGAGARRTSVTSGEIDPCRVPRHRAG